MAGRQWRQACGGAALLARASAHNVPMPTLTCPSCGHALTDSSLPCPHCAAVARGVAPAPRSRFVFWLIGLPVGAFALLMLAGALLSTPEDGAQWAARGAIKACHKEVALAPEDRQRPELSPGDCAQLDTEFRRRYRVDP